MTLNYNRLISKKRAVVSAINLVDGGTFKILLDCLSAAETALGPEWEVVALVHKKNLISGSYVRCIEFPYVKLSWLSRLYVEWIVFNKLSKELKPDLWFSLHDITPRIEAKRQALYAQNPAPFYRISLREAWIEPRFALFTALYRYLYGAFIHRNNFVVVQQCWLRDAFLKLFGKLNVIVAHPIIEQSCRETALPILTEQKKIVFLYPAFARVFKNFEVLCAAVRALPSAVTLAELIEVRLTIDGTESRYARTLIRQYGETPGLNFIGQQSREAIDKHYAECDVLVFPSKLETWGLPISEAKALGKPLLVADMPYARETVGNYNKVLFIDPNDPEKWTNKFMDILNGRIHYAGNTFQAPDHPYASNWNELWQLLTNGL